MELFAGVGGLTKAIVRLKLKVEEPRDSHDSAYRGKTKFDLTRQADVHAIAKLIKKGKVSWLHCAPPCATFSRARHGTGPRPVRSEERPEGLAEAHARSWKVIEANKLVRVTVKLAKLAAKAGAFFSIENPEESLMWKMPGMANLLNAPGVMQFNGDQCVFGGSYVKPTKWVTNAAWLCVVEKRCPGYPEHEPHAKLRGKVTMHDGSKGWMTSLAAEYHEGLCEALADAYAAAGTKGKELPEAAVIDEAGTHDPMAVEEAKQRRERENREAIGGMRDPARSVKKVPGWHLAGKKVREVLEPIVDEHLNEFENIFANIGKENSFGITEKVINKARKKMTDMMGCQNVRPPDNCIDPLIMAALIEMAQDPDDVLPAWVGGATPLGICREIETRGIFPTVTASAQQHETLEDVEAQIWWTEAAGNYKSVDQNSKAVEDELVKELEKGYMVWAQRKEDLEYRVGKLVLSKIGAVVTVKKGQTKTRLIHDLRRSLVNGMAYIPERGVLPRLGDMIFSAIDVARCAEEHEDVELLVLDFKDAFRHLLIDAEEQRFLAGQSTVDGVGGYFVFVRLLFGAISGPLTWGRLAAFLMRATAALHPPDRASVQCYVDDPCVAVRGSKRRRTITFGVIMLFWTSLLFKLSWSKGEIGSSVGWIGAELQLVKERGRLHRVRATLSEERMAKVKERADEFLAEQSSSRAKLREFAGMASWIGSIVKAARPYAQMLWAAACAKPAGWETWETVATRRVRLPLRWFSELAAKGEDVRCKNYLIQQPRGRAELTFDASLTGGGATLRIGDKHWYMACSWTKEDWRALGVVKKEPKDQPLWEAYMLLVAISEWAHLLDDNIGKLNIRGDAKGVLQATMKGRGKMPMLNEIVAETQLALATTRFNLVALHIWSEKNDVCDRLSRLDEGVRLPDVCLRWQRTPRLHQVQWRILGTG